jgi:RNA polymerase sigma-70 factor (ECF subfamily)
MAAKHDEGSNSSDMGWPHEESRSDGRDRAAAVDHLLPQIAHGDQEAFASVYDYVAGTVYGLVRRMVEDPARSESLTRDVLTEVWRTASLFRPSAGSGMSWIMAITRRHVIAYVRTARPAAGSGVSWRPHLSQVVNDVAEQAGVSPRGEPTADGLAQLPEPQRQALLLAYYGGYTRDQVAEFLVVPPGTVSAWIRDGLPRLRGRAEW